MNNKRNKSNDILNNISKRIKKIENKLKKPFKVKWSEENLSFIKSVTLLIHSLWSILEYKLTTSAVINLEFSLALYNSAFCIRF